MKRFMTYITLIFIASLVFYGGAGVNLVSYCCSCCEKYGIEALMSARCCKMHQTGDVIETEQGEVSAKYCVNKHSCGLERIDFKWISDDDPVLDIEPVEHDLFFATLFDYLEIQFYNHPFYEDLRITGPPVVALPRTYLSLLTTLLI